MNVRAIFGAAAVATLGLAPMTAGAVTFTGTPPGGPYPIPTMPPGGYSGEVDFDNGDPANTLTWTFVNSGSAIQVFALATATILQIGDAAFFAGGTTTSFLTNGGMTHDTPQGIADAFNLSALVDPGDSVVLTFEYGAVTEQLGNEVNFDWNVTATPIPIPAAGLLLLSGLGAFAGLGFLTRRHKAADTA